MPFHLLHFFDYTERRNLFEPNGINGGQSTIFDHLRNNKIPHRLIEGNDENSVFAKANETVEETRVRFLYLFLGRLDAHLHNHGTHSELAAKHIAWYDAQLRELFDSAKQRYEEVRLFVFSDHGMTDVIDTCDLMTRIESLGLRFGEDYAAVYDSTMARFWFLNDNARGPIEAVLREEPRGHIMTGEELARYGCDFPDQRYGQLFFLLDPGVLLCPSHMGLKPLAAMHGYTPEDKDSVAAFMTNVEDIDKPAGLADMCALIKSEAAAERVNYCERAG
jgi:hypothetical protein